MTVLAKKLFIKTYGCQMNVYDSAKMADVMAPLGYGISQSPDDADLIILNTCHIREHAAEKVYSELGRYKILKESRSPDTPLLLAVAGCVAQAEGAELTRRAPAVDILVGPQSYHRLPELVTRVTRQGGQALETDFPSDDKFDHLPSGEGKSGVTAFLTVQEGCDKFCTFCVVPFTRGAETSRPAQAILSEARDLVARGAREVTLLGQNVNAYHGAGADGTVWGLGRLARALAQIDGLSRIRYTTSHPRDMDDDLIAAHADCPALMPFVHLPVQSGSDGVLSAMNRRHTVDDYRRLVDRLRAARADLALSSDFIVGFPGEQDADFEATLRLIEQTGFAASFAFKYSRRPGTAASTMRGQVPEDVKDARLKALLALINRQQADFNAAQVGRVLPVLFEGPARHKGQWVGRSPYLQPVHVMSDENLGGMVRDVTLDELNGFSLIGHFAGDLH